jgi:DNA-3-methyladenine glycosylase
MSNAASRLIPQAFFRRDALEVAGDLLGMLIRCDRVVLRITEVEAYRWPGDSANHGRFGLTPRNAALWGPCGRAYVYTCYGMHHLLNLVTGRRGEAAAVLIRACEVIAGSEVVARRRAGQIGPSALAGPGRVGAALGLDPTWSHHPVYRRGGLEVRYGDRPVAIVRGPRVGIGYADLRDRAAPWRLAEAGSRWVSHRRGLR